MQRHLIEAITTEIAAKLPQFKTVDLFNDQFNKQDTGVLDSFRLPALFISFPDGANYIDKSAGVQTTEELTVRFLIADDLTKSRLSISKTVLDLIDLKQTVFTVFHGFQATGFSAFRRIFEEPDEDRTNYYVFIQDYTTKVVDSCKYVDNGTEVTATLDLKDEVIINPNTVDSIRTAKDVNDN